MTIVIHTDCTHNIKMATSASANSDQFQGQNTYPVRVILWSTPRSVSTSFLKCMTAVPDSQMWYEPFTMAKYFSHDSPYRDEIFPLLCNRWGAKDDGRVFASEVPGKSHCPVLLCP